MTRQPIFTNGSAKIWGSKWPWYARVLCWNSIPTETPTYLSTDSILKLLSTLETPPPIHPATAQSVKALLEPPCLERNASISSSPAQSSADQLRVFHVTSDAFSILHHTCAKTTIDGCGWGSVYNVHPVLLFYRQLTMLKATNIDKPGVVSPPLDPFTWILFAAHEEHVLQVVSQALGSQVHLFKNHPMEKTTIFKINRMTICMVWDGMGWYGIVWYGLVWYRMVWYGMVSYGMVWYGMVWYGMVSYGMVSYGMVWYGMVSYGLVWYGILWYGMVSYGMVWYGMVSYGMVWYGMVSYGMVWYGIVWYGLVWYGIVWSGMVWYLMVWYGIVWYGLVWYGIVWYGLVWYRMVWSGMVWYRMVWSGMVWYGIVWYGMVWYRMVWSGMVSYGMVWSGMVWYGLVWSGLVWYGLVWSGMVWSVCMYMYIYILCICVCILDYHTRNHTIFGKNHLTHRASTLHPPRLALQGSWQLSGSLKEPACTAQAQAPRLFLWSSLATWGEKHPTCWEHS